MKKLIFLLILIPFMCFASQKDSNIKNLLNKLKKEQHQSYGATTAVMGVRGSDVSSQDKSEYERAPMRGHLARLFCALFEPSRAARALADQAAGPVRRSACA